MDGALTMQIFKLLSGTPVLFADVRHYHADRGIWDLCNSGQHATWLAARSDDAAENLRHVELFPAQFYFPAGGASVYHVAAPGRVHVRAAHPRRRALPDARPPGRRRALSTTRRTRRSPSSRRGRGRTCSRGSTPSDGDVPRDVRLEPHPRRARRQAPGAAQRVRAARRRLHRALGAPDGLARARDRRGYLGDEGRSRRRDRDDRRRAPGPSTDSSSLGPATPSRTPRRSGGATRCASIRELLERPAGRARRGVRERDRTVRPRRRRPRTARCTRRSSTGSIREPRPRSTS